LIEPWLLGLGQDERDGLLAGPAAPSRALFEPNAAAGAGTASQVSFGILHGLYWLTVHAAMRVRLLVVVDDAQWADEPSLRFVLYLLGRIHDRPIALLVAARSGQPDEGGLVEQLSAHPVISILAPGPLGPAAVAELVRRRFPDADAAWCRRCFELTRGNPLQARELLAAVAHDDRRDLAR
jgi:predicted ATPase